MSKSYDLVVIGGGPGGYVAAARAASLGFKTAIVEKDRALGGTCLHRGCIPTKALLHAADTLDEVKHGSNIGIKASGVQVDWSEVQKYKERVVNTNAGGVAHLMKAKKIDVITGFGRLKDKNTVSVLSNNENTTLTAKHIIVAVGSKPRDLPNADTGKNILNSDTILPLKEIPGSLTIIGGGVIGIEFASIFARMGTKVTVLEALPRILAPADPDCAKELKTQFEKQGVTFHVNVKIDKVSNKSKSAQVLFTDAKGSRVQLDSDYVLVSIGRIPVTKDVGLENTKAKLDERGFVVVNGFMQTHEPNIYAIGDCVNTPWLAHIASKEGIIAVEHIKGLNPVPINYDHTPSCVYSEPPVAWAGLNEEEAKNRGLDFVVSKFDFSRNGKAAILQKTRGFVKFITDKRYGEILGVHIIGPDATELLAEPAFAMQIEATVNDIADTIHAHPTLYEAIYEAALNAVGREVHG
ncbi:MAG TPA: dihydrolipoyl dehydrogenase [Myxococcota bacterium]|nr:dihydrolipoyl dehydrogenase [Myxococcota bacterium]